ncbi:MAG: hypothetical protein ACKOQ1_03065 [Actinomycetota bacterium]
MSDADPVAAIDGVLAAFVARVPAESLSGSVHLHCPDADGEWMIERGSTGDLELSRRHAKGDCAIRGTAVMMLSVLSGAGVLADLEVIGDTGVADSFVAALRMN